jgi:hypothetical protein
MHTRVIVVNLQAPDPIPVRVTIISHLIQELILINHPMVNLQIIEHTLPKRIPTVMLTGHIDQTTAIIIENQVLITRKTHQTTELAQAKV